MRCTQWLNVYLLHVGHSRRDGGLPLMQVVLWHRIVVVLISQNLEARRAAVVKVTVAEAPVLCVSDGTRRCHIKKTYISFRVLYIQNIVHVCIQQWRIIHMHLVAYIPEWRGTHQCQPLSAVINEMPEFLAASRTKEVLPPLPSSQNFHASFCDPTSTNHHSAPSSLFITQKKWTYNNVSSNCALRLPSIVVAVQLSGQWTWSQLCPKFNMGSMVNVYASFGVVIQYRQTFFDFEWREDVPDQAS